MTAPPATRTVAAFDFDGTLTRVDSLLPFLRRVAGARAVAAALATHVVPAVASRRLDRDAAKERLLTALLGGRDASEVRVSGDAYGARLARSGIRPHLRDRLEEHRAAGHELVLVSASLDAYLVPLGRELGLDAVLCSRLEVDAAGALTGRLEGGNCRGPAKAACLATHVGAGPAFVWAYGDSAGDRELLAEADRAVRVARWPRRVVLPPLSEPRGS